LYWGSNLPRLQAIKAAYDPTGVFTCLDCVTAAEEEEPESGCGDCVSQEAFNELYHMAMENAETIAALEAQVAELSDLEETVNEVDSAMTEMATCMAAFVSDDDDDEEPEMPEESTVMPTEPMTTMIPTEPVSTMIPTEPVATTLPIGVSTTLPIGAVTTTTTWPIGAVTMAPSKTPSATPPIFAEWPMYAGMVCASGSNPPRTFKTSEYDTPAECADRCLRTQNCMYFSFSEGGNCIGCTEEPSVSNSHTTTYLSYAMSGRRRLSELEMLRAENAALKEMLAKARRN